MVTMVNDMRSMLLSQSCWWLQSNRSLAVAPATHAMNVWPCASQIVVVAPIGGGLQASKTLWERSHRRCRS